MQITVERFDRKRHQPDLIVLVGDPHLNFLGELEGELREKVEGFSEGFATGRLAREIAFSVVCKDSGEAVEYLYFHTSTEKGFTPTENLKTFVSRALRLASETGRKTVGVHLAGPDGEGLIEALVEGALVGTFKFTDFLKDNTDRFAEMELVLYLPTPEPTQQTAQTSEVAASKGAPVERVEEALEPDAVPSAEKTGSTEAAAVAEAAEQGASEQAQQDPWPAPPADDQAPPTDDQAPLSQLELDPHVHSDFESELASEETNEAVEGEAELSSQEPERDEFKEKNQAIAGWSEDEKTAWRTKDESAVRVGGAFGRGVNLARTLIAQPASVCTPAYLAKTGETIAKKYGFAFKGRGLKELVKEGFVGHVAVGGGSANPPTMFELSYQPAAATDVHLVLVGKGVTFDTGGISIKPADKMHLMVGDMSGAAAVLGTMDILGQIRPSIKVTAIVVSAENSPDGKSFRPGDILRYKNGLSVHIENTDAEGRLLLADGLIRAGELGATHVIDIATLTGACSRALGPSFTGIMGANRKLVNAITRAGGNHGESYWRLPLPVEYRSMLKTIHADLNNVGGPNAGATTAALFLQEFVPARTPWVHLDIAGTFWKSKAWKYYQEGPSGTGVKTLADLALRWHEHMA